MRGRSTAILLVGLTAASPSLAQNLVSNGSFENSLTGFTVGGTARDGYVPVAVAYNQASGYPSGAQGEVVPADNAVSKSPDTAGGHRVYFVSDEATNLSLSQSIYLTPGSYDIGFDSFDTYNGSMQPHDAQFTAQLQACSLPISPHRASHRASGHRTPVWRTLPQQATTWCPSCLTLPSRPPTPIRQTPAESTTPRISSSIGRM